MEKSTGQPVHIALPPPPREVRGGAGAGLWLARVFMLPHTLVGIASIGFLIFLVLWQLFGTEVPGVITGVETRHRSKGGDIFEVKYAYSVGAEKREKNQTVDRATFEHFQNLAALPESDLQLTVKQFAIGSMHYASVPAYESIATSIAILGTWALIWNGIVGAFLYQLWVKPIRLWSLYKHGLAAAGTITSKRMSRSRSKTCYVSYRFHDPLSGREVSGECEVKRMPWEKVVTGEQVTVIYAAESPRRSTVYGMGSYEVSETQAIKRR